MKTTFCILSLAVGLMISPAHAADSTLNITGNVVDNTCEISTESQNFSVNLQTHASKQFLSQGSVSEMVPFSIVFSNCGSAATGVRLGFSGVAISPDSPLLKNDSADDAAEGIGIQILDATRKVVYINLDQDSLGWNRIEAGSGNALQFYARMVANEFPVTAGRVRATATMTLEFQ